jgi:hypothetical protein
VSDAAGQPGGTQRTSPRHPRRLVWQREATEEPLPAPEPGILHRARVAAVARWVLLPPWAQALVVFAVSRVIGFLIIDRTGRFQSASIWSGPQPGYLGMVGLWDGDWYHRIADNGYPRILPRNPDGLVAQNEWAFYPLYPYLTRAVMGLTGAGWPLAATITSMLCAAGAVVLIRSVTARVAGPSLAMWTVVLFCCYPAAPVLQLAYAESLSLLVLAGLLWCLQRHRYLLAIPVVLLAGLARPIAVPIVALVFFHLLRRWRDPERPGARTWAALLGLLAASAVAAALWPAVAAVVTGEVSAYTDTEVAWRVSHTLVPLLPWWDMSRYVLGNWVGPAVVVLVLAALAVWMTRPVARVIRGDLRTWVWCYTLYLLAVVDPFTSLARLLLPLFPLGTVLAAASRSRAYRIAVALAFLAGQVVWVGWLWRFSPPADWPP